MTAGFHAEVRMNLSVEVWARHENSSFARSTWERIRWCPSCYNAERTKAMQWMAHLAKHQHWRPEQRATLNALKLRLIGNASAKPTNNLRGDASAVCMWDCFRRATMLEPLVSHLLQRHVPGDFLEAGVFRGGISIYMAALLAVDGALGNGAHQRRMWLADSFSGMPSANYTAEWAARRRSANRSTWQAETLIARDRDTRGLSTGVLRSSLDEVASNVRQHLRGVLREQPLSLGGSAATPCDERAGLEGLTACGVRFVPGLFATSLPGPVGPLALLRIDADLYTSIIEVLEALYPRLSSGGFVVFDGACGDDEPVDEPRVLASPQLPPRTPRMPAAALPPAVSPVSARCPVRSRRSRPSRSELSPSALAWQTSKSSACKRCGFKPKPRCASTRPASASPPLRDPSLC